MPAVGITDRPPPGAHDHRAICSHLARRWAVLERQIAWLFVKHTSKVVFQRNTQS